MRWLWLPMLGFGTYLVADTWAEGNLLLAGVYGVVFLALTWWLSPWSGGLRQQRHADVMGRPPEARSVVIYWRPGCAYCARLRARLGRTGRRALWVDIWRDEDAASYVRSVNEGNETVPTVVIDGHPVTNPDPALVRDRLGAR